VSAENGGTISFVDARADTVAGVATIGDRTTKPTGLALSPDENTLYVANGRANEVVMIDVASRAVIASVAVGERPWGIALSRDGRTLYTANGRSGSVSVIDVASRRVTSTISVGGRPYTVLIAP
jgi:YVTN family beta-propeller protein